MNARRFTELAAGLSLAVAGAIAWGAAIDRRSPKLSEFQSGDPLLLARIREFLSSSEQGALDRLSVSVIEDGLVTEAHFGADADTEYMRSDPSPRP